MQKNSLNNLLLNIPLHEINFLTSLPDKEIFYNKIETNITSTEYDQLTILKINDNDDWVKLNDDNFTNRLAQANNLVAIFVITESEKFLWSQIANKFNKLQIPIIQIATIESLHSYLDGQDCDFNYKKLSNELDGFYKRGFIDVAENLAMAFQTTFSFLDEDNELLWQTHYEESEQLNMQNKSNSWASNIENNNYYEIEVANKINIKLMVSSKLTKWQELMLNKYIGFTALVLQTDEVIRDQHERFKEFFIYELVYRKFESKQVLINQGKTWGWNLEKSHHLLVIDLQRVAETNGGLESIDEVVLCLEDEAKNISREIIIFPFQDHIIVLVEDNDDVTLQKRRETPIAIAERLLAQIKPNFPSFNFNIGIGIWYQDTINLNKSYQEAKIAIQFGKLWNEKRQIYHMYDLGTLNLLTNIHEDLLTTFCEQYLAPLVISDENLGTEHLHTLKMYFQYNGNINEASDEMYIHPNTMRKRLRRVEELLGIHLYNLTDSLSLMLAVKIYFSFNISLK